MEGKFRQSRKSESCPLLKNATCLVAELLSCLWPRKRGEKIDEEKLYHCPLRDGSLLVNCYFIFFIFVFILLLED